MNQTTEPHGQAARRTPPILYRAALAKDAADQAEVFHHAVMQGAMSHYTAAEREAWASVLPRDATAWAARQVMYTTLVATCHGRCVGFLELDIPRGYIETLYVWPSLSGRGIGSTLLIHAERLLIEHGLGTARIHASLVIADALARRGWRELGEEWVERAGASLCRKHFEKRLNVLET